MPAELPAPDDKAKRAEAVAAWAIEYARRLQHYGDGLAAIVNRCAGETRRNADAHSAWANKE